MFCNHLDGEKRAGCFAFFVFCCLVIIVWLILMMPWVCMQFVIVEFPDHTIFGAMGATVTIVPANI